MIIGVLKESFPETRVSLLPEHIATLKKWNVDVCVESQAGMDAFAADDKYSTAGATVKSREEVLQNSDIILSIQPIENSKIENQKSKIILKKKYTPPLKEIDLISKELIETLNKGI